MMRTSLLLAFALVAVDETGCALVSGAYGCSGDGNCPSGEICASGVCKASAPAGEGEGTAGEGEGTAGEGEGASEGEGEGEGEGVGGEGEGEGEGEGVACAQMSGSFTLINNGDVTHFQQSLPGGSGCVFLTGTLEIRGDFSSFPELQRIAGIGQSFKISSTGGATQTFQDLPNLTAVGLDVDVESTAALGALHLPALTHIGHAVILKSNNALNALDFAALTDVDGNVDAENNPQLCASDVDSLVGQLTTFGGIETNTGNNGQNCN